LASNSKRKLMRRARATVRAALPCAFARDRNPFRGRTLHMSRQAILVLRKYELNQYRNGGKK